MEESKKISAKRTLVSPLYWGRSLNKPPPLKIRASWTRGLSSAEAPVGYPYKNSNNRKNIKRAEEDGKRKKAGSSLLSFPFPSCPARCLFLSPQLPHNTKWPLRRRLRGTGMYFWHGWIAKSEMEDLENKKELCCNLEKWLIYIIVTATF